MSVKSYHLNCLHVFVWLHFCLEFVYYFAFIGLFNVCPFVCIYVCIYIYIYIYIYNVHVYMYVKNQSICQPVQSAGRSSAVLSVYPSAVHPSSVCLSVCLSVRWYVCFS